MAATTDILVCTSEPQLQGEIESACAALGESQPRLRFVPDRRELLEAVRSLPPRLVLAEFGDPPGETNRLAGELAAASPPVPLAAILPPQGFDSDVSESTILIEAMRAGVRDFLRRPVSTTELRSLIESVERGDASQQTPHTPARGVVYSFISNKGGVGKSTLAVNTAVGLATRHPGRVLLIDASLQMGVAAALLDLQPETTLADLALERDRLDETIVRQVAAPHHSGLALLAAPNDAVEAIDVDDTFLARVITLARRVYDFVVVDTFPMFDSVVIAVLDLSDLSYVIVENVVPTLLGAIRLLDVLERIGFPRERQRVVINRHQRIAGNVPLGDVAARLGRPIDYVLPFDKRVIAAANQGEPLLASTFRFAGFVRGVDRMVSDMDLPATRAAEASAQRPGPNGHGLLADQTFRNRAGEQMVDAVVLDDELSTHVTDPADQENRR